MVKTGHREGDPRFLDVRKLKRSYIYMVGIILPNKHKIIISRKFQSKKGRIDGGGGLKMPIFAGRPL